MNAHRSRTRKGSVVRACYNASDLTPAFVGSVPHTVSRILRHPTRVKTAQWRILRSWIVFKT